MVRRKHGPEQIVALCDKSKWQSPAENPPRRAETPESKNRSCYRWRKEFGGPEPVAGKTNEWTGERELAAAVPSD